MLYTNLKHIENATAFSQCLTENENVVIICGRMDVDSVNVYRAADGLKARYRHVKFFDLESDNPVSAFFHSIPGVAGQKPYPVTVCFKNGSVEKVIAGSLSKNNLSEILEEVYETVTV